MSDSQPILTLNIARGVYPDLQWESRRRNWAMVNFFGGGNEKH